MAVLFDMYVSVCPIYGIFLTISWTVGTSSQIFAWFSTFHA